MPLLIKLCGITNPTDACQALSAGADWIGLNFVGGPRRIDLIAARAILRSMDDPARAVALIETDGQAFSIPLDELNGLGIRRVQLYGGLNARSIGRLRRRGFECIQVQPVEGPDFIARLRSFLNDCGDDPPRYVLLDAHVPGQRGGTGVRADWNAIQAGLSPSATPLPPVILAGGLSAANVAEAVRMLAPAGVDVSSGVESSPGRKDPAQVAAFVAAARSAAR